jgi:transcriptional regulator with PAS, ATPase and Fis domain
MSLIKLTLTDEQKKANAEAFARANPEAEYKQTDDAAHAFLTVTDSGREVVKFARRFSAMSEPVLITGESGTGKELIAKILHGERQKTTFRAVNCAGITDTLFESELFGYEEGSFTGALKGGRRGMIEQAAGGTLFLDEIGDMPTSQQVKLLRVLQEREFYRVGGHVPIKAECRFIFATNKDLGVAVADGTFRADLFFRIYRLHVHIPSLAERPDDVLLIVKSLCDKYGMDFGDLPPVHTLRYREGNVRQLEGEVLRAFYR